MLYTRMKVGAEEDGCELDVLPTRRIVVLICSNVIAAAYFMRLSDPFLCAELFAIVFQILEACLCFL